MITRHAAESALAHARELAGRGEALTQAMRGERAGLLRAVDAELHSLEAHAVSLRPAAEGGDRDAAAKLLAITESQGDLRNARQVLENAP